MEISTTSLLILGYWLLFGIAVLLCIGATFSVRVFLSFAIGLFLFNFLARVLCIGINETVGIFAPKIMSDFAIRKYYQYIPTGDFLGLFQEPFGAQVYANLTIWAFTEPSLYTLSVCNAAAGALAGPIAGLMIQSVTSRRTAVVTAILFSFYLGMFNFSIFCLRDPLLVLANTLIACVIVRMGFGSKRIRDYLFGAIGVYFSLWLRPEQFYIILFVLGLPFFAYYVQLFFDQTNRKRSFAIAVFLSIPVCAIGFASLLAATYVGSSNIGHATINPLEVAGERAEERFSRHTDSDFGSGSHIIAVKDYGNIPIYIRVPIQVIGLVVLPFPWQIDNTEKLLAFVDSLSLIYMIWIAIRYSWNRGLEPSHQWIVIALLATFAISVLGMGVMISNAGNGFRMRISLVPFLILAASLARTEKSIARRRIEGVD